MNGEIAALDRGLAVAGKWVHLRRTIGDDENTVFVEVRVRARVDAMDNTINAAGHRVSEYALIISPTQINEAQWPGGTIPSVPPFNVDQRIPRKDSTDQILMYDLHDNPLTITFVDAKIFNDELLRINLRCAG